MKILIVLSSMLFLSGCCSISGNESMAFQPERLPIATIGKEYSSTIYINGALVTWLSFVSTQLYAKELLINGLNIKIVSPTSERPERRGVLYIFGIPEGKGSFEFTIEGNTVGTQCRGMKFEKTFTITTVEPGQKSSPQNITTVNNTSITKACG